MNKVSQIFVITKPSKAKHDTAIKLDTWHPNSSHSNELSLKKTVCREKLSHTNIESNKSNHVNQPALVQSTLDFGKVHITRFNVNCSDISCEHVPRSHQLQLMIQHLQMAFILVEVINKALKLIPRSDKKETNTANPGRETQVQVAISKLPVRII